MKKRITYCLILLSVLATPMLSQRGLAGVWKGKITTGGIYSEQGYEFELYLEVSGKMLSGKTYVYVSKEEVIEMQVRGRLYDDRSATLYEYEFVPQPMQKSLPDFNRKYQLVFKDSAFKSKISLNGYWQQITPMTFMSHRKRGRIFLKRVDDFGA